MTISPPDFDDRYNLLYDNAPIGILSLNASGQIVGCNASACALLARGRNELLGTPILKWLTPVDRERGREHFMHALEGLPTEWAALLRCGDGVLRRVHLHIVPYPLATGTRMDVLLTERDTEHSMRPADASVLELLTTIPGVFALVLDADLRIRHARGMSRTHWCRDDEVIGRELVSLLTPSEKNLRQLESMRHHVAPDSVWSGMFEHMRADGSAFAAHVYVRRRDNARLGTSEGVVLAGREANDEVALREEVGRAQRMSAIGTVTTAVARELSAGIISTRTLLEAEPALVGDARAALADLQRVTQTLLTFAADAPLERTTTEVPALVREVAAELEPDRAAAGAELLVHCPADVPDLEVDPRQVREIIRQVLRNALEAVAHSEERRVTIRVEADERLVLVHVTDSGPGMTAGVEARAYEPFFTTKTGRFGLGLAIAGGLVTAHGGRIFSHSQGHGTQVTIELPRAPGMSAPVFRAAPLLLGKNRSVLLVDDEAAVRHLFRRVLEKVGYRTTEAWSGRSALAAISNGEQPDFLVTDLRMTGGNGYWLLRQIGRDFPDLLKRTVIVTGEQSETQLDRIARETGCAVLRKPVDARTLLEVLDSLALRAAGN